MLLGADSNKISTVNNFLAPDSQYLHEKSGAGFLDAIDAVAESLDEDFFIDSYATQSSDLHYFYAGQKIRAVMAYDKLHTKQITSADDMDIINFYLKKSNGSTVASSVSNRNNVRIIEHVVTSSGYYYFSVVPSQLIKNTGSNNYAGVNAHISASALSAFRVQLNKSGGTGGTSSITTTYGVSMPSITLPNRTDNIFSGYYDTSITGDGTQYYTPQGTSARTWNKYSNSTIYAQWRKLGDVNYNNAIDMADVVLVQKHIAEIITLTGNDFLAADVNRNGQVDMSDVILIQNHISGVITSFDNISKSTSLYIDYNYIQQNFPTEFELLTNINDINGGVTIMDLQLVEQYVDRDINLNSLSTYYNKNFSLAE